MAATADKTNPQLWETVKQRVTKGDKGGRPGQWSARKAKSLHHGVQILRHTFCSHLAMHGAPARAIQELAAHMDLSMTQRYMHLSPAATENAIRLLDGRPSDAGSAKNLGDILDTRSVKLGSD